MQLAGELYIPDRDTFFGPIFESTGDRFDDRALIDAIKYSHVAAIGLDIPVKAIDVGAHVGSWTRVMADEFDCVMAIEAVYENYQCLVKNTEHLENVSTFCSAAGPHPGFVRLAPGANEGNSGTWHIDPKGKQWTVMTTLDFLPTEGCRLLKIDAEGYELGVLSGAEALLENEKPVLVIEQNELSERYDATDEDIKKLLTSFGYALRAKVNKDFIYDHTSRW